MRSINMRPDAWNDLRIWIQENPKTALRIHRLLD